MMKVLRKKRKGGFTLIELVVVIAILGILAAIAVPRLASVRVGAEEKAHNANVRTIESAVSLYMANTGTALTAMDDITVLVPNYIQAVPTNPLPAGHAQAGAYTITNGVVAPILAP